MNKTALLFGVGASLILAAGTANAAGTCGAEVAELQQKLGVEEGANATIGATDPGVQQPDPSASVDPSASADTSTSTTTSPSGSDQTADADNDANATIGATDPGVQQPDPGASADTSTTTTTDGSTTTADTTTTTTTTETTTDGSTTTADTSTSSDGSSMPTNNEDSGANATIGPTDPGVQQPQDMGATADSGDSSTTTTTTDSSSTTADSTTTMPSGDVTETSRVGDLNTAAGGRAEAITALKKAQMHADAGDENACMTELSTAKTALGVE